MSILRPNRILFQDNGPELISLYYIPANNQSRIVDFCNDYSLVGTVGAMSPTANNATAMTVQGTTQVVLDAGQSREQYLIVAGDRR